MEIISSDGKDFDTPSDIGEASLDALMDPFPCPNVSVFEILEDINLAGSFWSILKPAIPVSVIGKPVLPGTGPKHLIP